MRWIHTQPLEHADRIELRCRLHQASEYHLLEHVVLNRPEAQARIRSSQRGPEHVAGGPHDANTAGTRCGGRARWRRSIRDERRLPLCGPGKRGIHPGTNAQLKGFLLALENLAASLDQQRDLDRGMARPDVFDDLKLPVRSEEHTSELQSRGHLVCRLLLEKKKKE